MSIAIKKIKFIVGEQKLDGLVYEVSGARNPGLVILRGGANIPNNEGDNPRWQQAMAVKGINSLSFDFRGVGSSEGELSETSLQMRCEDARMAVSTLKTNSSTGGVYLVGVSMGAPVAIAIAKEVGAKGVVLVSPAAYSAEAWKKNFGPEFTKALRKENSWKGSPDFDRLREFEGRILLAFGGRDAIIPKPILDTYAAVTKEKNQTVLAFGEAKHSFLRLEDSDNARARESFYSSLATFVNSSS